MTFCCSHESIDKVFDLEMDFLMSVLVRGFFAASNIQRKLCVAVSGGSDSVALLSMATKFSHEKQLDVVCVTVDHKLRSESSAEADFVKDLCELRGVQHVVLEWDRDGDFPSTSIGKLENAARDARYSLLKNFCEASGINIVLTGHTLDDQLETFEMRKDSGSKESGLACMSKIHRLYDDASRGSDVFVLRPLLQFQKDTLRKFLLNNGIPWKYDPMNEDTAFKRVRYRKKIATYNDSKRCEDFQVISELGRRRRAREIAAVRFLGDDSCCIFHSAGYTSIDFPQFLMQEEETQCEIIRRVIWDIGGKKYPANISCEMLQKIIRKKINTLGGCLIRLSKQTLRISKENRNLDKEKFISGAGSCILNGFLVIIGSVDADFNDKITEYVVSCGCWSHECVNLSLEISRLLPCVYVNGEVVFAHGAKHKDGMLLPVITCDFIHRKNLFDVFV